MDLVRPFAGTLFRNYQGLEQVPELSPNAITRQARLGVDFCLSMMKLNNLQQYRTVRYLPLADGGYGALHVTVLPGYGGQPMVSASLEVSRRRVEEEEEEIKEGLFIINNRWLLEPNPKVKPSGKLVGKVGDWRLFDTEGKVFKAGQQYNGFCTQSTDGKTQHAVWVYEDEAGKKWIAENDALPYLDAVAGNGDLQAVPTQAAEAAGGCWFWYANDVLMGSYNILESYSPLLLMEWDTNSWSFHSVDLEAGGDGPSEYSWTAWGNRADMSIDGTYIILRSDQYDNYYSDGTHRYTFEITFQDKSAIFYSDEYPRLFGLYGRQEREIVGMGSNDTLEQKYEYNFFPEVPVYYRYEWVEGEYGPWLSVEEHPLSAAPEALRNPYMTPEQGTWVYTGERTEIYTGNYRGQYSESFTDWDMIDYLFKSLGRYNYYKGIAPNAIGEGYYKEGSLAYNYIDKQVSSSALNVYHKMRQEQTYIYIKYNMYTEDFLPDPEWQNNPYPFPEKERLVQQSSVYVNDAEVFQGVEIRHPEIYPLPNEFYEDKFAVVTEISTVTTDLCGLFTVIPINADTELPDITGTKLWGVAKGEATDISALLDKDIDLKGYIKTIAATFIDYDYYYRDKDLIPIPATRGRAFSAPE